MKQILFKYWPAMLLLCYAAAVAVFWGRDYVAALSYQEQYQLFLSTGSYFLQRLSVPGGLMDYVGEFLVQFNHWPVMGVAILVALLLGMQLLTWLVARRGGAGRGWLPLCYLPSVLLWAYMGDENVMLAFGLALTCVLGLMLLYTYVQKTWAKMLLLGLSATVGYWLIGSVVAVVVLFAALWEWLRSRSLGRAVCTLGWLLVLAFVLLGCSYVVAYPVPRLVWGIGYYRYPVYNPAMQLLVAVATGVLPLLIVLLPGMESMKTGRRTAIVAAEVLVLALGGGFWVKACFDPATYELIEYDFLLRTEQWDKIIAKAERKQASSPLSVATVNLALSQEGQLADRLFEFYQNGGEGLFPVFVRNMVSPVTTAEVFYRLGMVNEAERYMFEAQEAIPNYRKSGRLTKRIIDCEIVNGHYAVARKHLRLLQQSPFYRKWAESRLQMLRQPQSVTADEEYGRLRRLRQKRQDFLFSDREMDQMLGLLFTQNKENKMAYEYLVCYDLLQRDLDHFMRYYSLGRYVDYDHIPRPFQEILIGRWLQTHGSLQGLPYSIDRSTLDNTVSFVRTFMTNKADPALNQLPLCTNAWNYMLRADKPAERKDSSAPVY